MDSSKFDLSKLSSLSQTLSDAIQPISSKIDYGSMINMEKNPDGYLVEYEDISAKDFLNKLYSSGKIFHLGDPKKITRVTGVVKIDQKKFNKEYGVFENFEFEDSVTFHGESKGNPFKIGKCVIFLNCTLKKFLSFKFCNSEDLPVENYKQETEAIQLYGGDLNAINFEYNHFPFGIAISDFQSENPKIRSLEMKFNNFSKAGILVKSTEIFDLCEITGNQVDNIGIDFIDCLIKCPLRISSNTAPSLVFSGTKTIIEKDIKIWSGQYDSLIWNDGIFKGEIDISSVMIEKFFSLIGSNFEDKFQFERKDRNGQVINLTLPDEIFIQDSSFKNGFEFKGDKFKGKQLTLNFSEKSAGVIDFQDVFFQKVILKGNNFNCSVFLRDCSYDILTFQNFFNKSQLSLSNNNPIFNDGIPKELKIEHSNLGNTEFYDIDFSIYSIIRVINSRLDNIFAFGVEWFKEKQLHVDEEETSTLKILSQKREIYRQLKFAAEKQSDRITALAFKEREINTHKRYLNEKRGERKPKFYQKFFDYIKFLLIKLVDKLNLESKIIKIKSNLDFLSDNISIYLGKTNSHGQNWIYPLLLIIGITLTSFPFFMILSDPEITFGWNWNLEGWNLFWYKFAKHSHAIPQLFNPARRLSDLFDNTNSFWLHFLDGLHRIILAFFIFQIVSAFRKFVK